MRRRARQGDAKFEIKPVHLVLGALASLGVLAIMGSLSLSRALTPPPEPRN